MLKISLLEKTQEFFDNYVENHMDDDVTVITPNPSMADLVRKRFDSLGKSVDSITISKFMKNQLNEIVDDSLLENYKGKSELILLLGAIWKKLGKDADYIGFKRAFNLLTEFRSFSVSDHVLETVLENYDEELGHGVLWLHRFLNELNLIDEHKSYFLLSERLREGDLPPDYKTDKKLIFYGFDFLTASQVDMLKSFALRDEVIIPFYKTAYEKSSNLDWIKWFDEHNLEIDDLSTNSESEQVIDLYRFPKNYMGRALLSLSESNMPDNLLLGTKTLDREQFQEIPFGNIKAKFAVDLFEESYEEFISLIKNEVAEFEQLNEVLRSTIKEWIDSWVKLKKFRLIKVALIFLNKLNEWEELSDENNSLSLFDYQILVESLKLDLPRINLTNLDPQARLNLLTLTDIEDIKNKEVIFAMNSNHSGIRGVGSNYSENVEKYLTSIGPIRRAELDIEVFKAKFHEFLSDNQVRMFIEEGLIEHDMGISQIFSTFETVKQDNKISFDIKKEYLKSDVFESNLEKLSASRLQKYLECPRKYYMNYISELNPKVEFDSELSVLDLGSIEHKIIEDYFKSKSLWDEDFFEKLLFSILKSYIQGKNIERLDEYIIEIKAYTQNAIKALIALKEKYGFDYKFELPFSTKERELKFNGSIDLYAKNNEIDLIIDFKRSNRIFSSFTSIMEFEQIQLWFYYLRLKNLNIIQSGKALFLGYVDLSNIENSMFFTNDKTLMAEFKATSGFGKIKEIKELEELGDKYSDFENELVDRLSNEKRFLPKPLNKTSCGFCTIKNICPRE